jgi:hypothetical protein
VICVAKPRGFEETKALRRAREQSLRSIAEPAIETLPRP